MSRAFPIDAEWLRQQYSVEGRPVPSIAADLGCNRRTVYRALHRFQIPHREPVVQPIPPSPFEDVLGPERLRRMYVDEARSTYEIAALVGCSGTTVSAFLHRHGIPTRPSRRAGRDALKAAC